MDPGATLLADGYCFMCLHRHGCQAPHGRLAATHSCAQPQRQHAAHLPVQLQLSQLSDCCDRLPGLEAEPSSISPVVPSSSSSSRAHLMPPFCSKVSSRLGGRFGSMSAFLASRFSPPCSAGCRHMSRTLLGGRGL